MGRLMRITVSSSQSKDWPLTVHQSKDQILIVIGFISVNSMASFGKQDVKID